MGKCVFQAVSPFWGVFWPPRQHAFDLDTPQELSTGCPSPAMPQVPPQAHVLCSASWEPLPCLVGLSHAAISPRAPNWQMQCHQGPRRFPEVQYSRLPLSPIFPPESCWMKWKTALTVLEAVLWVETDALKSCHGPVSKCWRINAVSKCYNYF